MFDLRYKAGVQTQEQLPQFLTVFSPINIIDKKHFNKNWIDQGKPRWNLIYVFYWSPKEATGNNHNLDFTIVFLIIDTGSHIKY